MKHHSQRNHKKNGKTHKEASTKPSRDIANIVSTLLIVLFLAVGYYGYTKNSHAATPALPEANSSIPVVPSASSVSNNKRVVMSVRVTNQSNRPISNAEVGLSNQKVETNSNGIASLNTGVGEYRLGVNSDGSKVYATDITVLNKTNQQFSVILRPVYSVSWLVILWIAAIVVAIVLAISIRIKHARITKPTIAVAMNPPVDYLDRPLETVSTPLVSDNKKKERVISTQTIKPTEPSINNTPVIIAATPGHVKGKKKIPVNQVSSSTAAQPKAPAPIKSIKIHVG